MKNSVKFFRFFFVDQLILSVSALIIVNFAVNKSFEDALPWLITWFVTEILWIPFLLLTFHNLLKTTNMENFKYLYYTLVLSLAIYFFLGARIVLAILFAIDIGSAEISFNLLLVIWNITFLIISGSIIGITRVLDPVFNKTINLNFSIIGFASLTFLFRLIFWSTIEKNMRDTNVMSLILLGMAATSAVCVFYLDYNKIDKIFDQQQSMKRDPINPTRKPQGVTNRSINQNPAKVKQTEVLNPTKPVKVIGDSDPIGIVKERYARGEINREEFDIMIADLSGGLLVKQPKKIAYAYCPSCNADNSDESAFCMNCGIKF